MVNIEVIFRYMLLITRLIHMVKCYPLSDEVQLNEEKQYCHIAMCLHAIMKVEENNHHYIIIGDEIRDYKLNNTVLLLPWPKTIASLATLKSSVKQLQGIFLLFPDTNATNYEMLLEITSEQNNVKYVIFTESVLTVFHMLEQFWEFKILDVIALYHSKNEVITAFTYLPFGVRGCDTDKPVRINRWVNGRNRFQSKTYLFSRKNKVYNLYGCPVKATLKQTNRQRSVYADQKFFVDIPQKIFHFLEERMNFTGIIVSEEAQSANGYALAYMNLSNTNLQLIAKGDADIAVGRFSMMMDYTANVLAPLQISMDCFTWAVPVKAGSKPSMWTTYVYEFDAYTWIVILNLWCGATGFFLAICQIKINKLDPFTRSFSGISSLGILLGIAIKTKPKIDSLRVFYVSLVLFCFVTNSAYQAIMGSLVTVPPDSKNIKDTDELLDTDLILTGYPRMFYLLSSSIKSSHTVYRVLQKFQTLNPGSFAKTLYQVYDTRKYAVFEQRNLFNEYKRRIQRDYNISEPYYIVPKCLFTSHNTPFLMKTNSILAEPLINIGISLIESGIIRKWQQMQNTLNMFIFSNATTNEEKVRKYSIEQLKGGLIVLICGYIISITVFLVEILTKGFKYKSTNTHSTEANQLPTQNRRFLK